MAQEEKNPLFSERVREQLLLQRILVLDGFIDEIVGSFGQIMPARKHRIGLKGGGI